MNRDEQGSAFPSPLVILTIVAIAMAGIAFLATQDKNDGSADMSVVSQPSTVPQPTASQPAPSATVAPTKPEPTKHKPEFVRGETYVEVYNNSGINGLAADVSAQASTAGWNVVATDNWYGTIPSSTVYYPPRLKAAAQALAKDLDIARTFPAVDPMKLDRLTVILTG